MRPTIDGLGNRDQDHLFFGIDVLDLVAFAEVQGLGPGLTRNANDLVLATTHLFVVVVGRDRNHVGGIDLDFEHLPVAVEILRVLPSRDVQPGRAGNVSVGIDLVPFHRNDGPGGVVELAGTAVREIGADPLVRDELAIGRERDAVVLQEPVQVLDAFDARVALLVRPEEFQGFGREIGVNQIQETEGLVLGLRYIFTILY